MIYASPTGHIIDIGRAAFYADGKNNDASIFINQTQDTTGIMSFAEQGDFLVWDRGFRDANELASHLGFSVHMPHFLPRGQAQHTTQEANESRMVTKIRWVVESINSRVKRRFKFFLHTIENSYLPQVSDLFKIACCIINAYSPPLKMDSEEDSDLAKIMLSRAGMPNLMQSLVENENLLTRRVIWLEINDSSIPDFPKLSERDLRMLTLGVYQLKEAVSYTAEHLNPDGMYQLFHHKDEKYKEILFAKIQSRHHSGSSHKVFIHYLAGSNSISGVTGWYCQCPAGKLFFM